MRWARHYRGICFAVLLVAYLAVLFGVCDLHDVRELPHDALRVLAATSELALAALLGAGCTRLQRRHASAWWLAPAALLAALVGAVYVAQIISLVVSNNFISVLALENTDSASLAPVPLPLSIGVAALGLAWYACFCAGLIGQRNAPPVGSERWPRYAYFTALTATAVIVAGLLGVQRKNAWLEPGYRQAPLVNLVANAYAGSRNVAPSAADGPRARDCFADPGRDARGRYPFQKALAYQTALPYAKARGGTPNVIVIFTEGTSTRLIGAYGGHYPGLTPNIDRLAARSMRVDDYFNHTAATYRGLIGQLSSGYVYYGGYGKHGWETTAGGRAASTIRRRTLPTILGEHGYQSYFFSPHAAHLPFTAMLGTLGFDQVFNADSIGHGLLDDDYHTRAGTDSLDDASLFRGLVAFLKRRQTSSEPFFIGIYNIGTHAFIRTDKYDVRYGDSQNPVLNGLHNYDHAIGLFLDYFLHSPYAASTIVVFTADHATYPDADYRAVAGAGLQPYFVDRVPLLIDDPFHLLPREWNADARNSLDLAPTLLQLLGIQAARNSFLGRSLFEPRSFRFGLSALGSQFYLTTGRGIFNAANVTQPLQPVFACEVHIAREYYEAEATNRIASPAQPH